jgi:ribosomal protein S18 acetylase RimI-like enzyme
MGATKIAFRKEVRPGDTDIVESIVRSTGKFNEDEVQIARELVLEELSKGAASEYFFVFAERDGGVVGYTCYGPIRGSHHRYEIYWIAVHSSSQGGGLGKALMEETERAIRERGGLRVYVETSSREEYLPTQRFYHARGYALVAHIDGYYSDADGLLVYGKQLESPLGISVGMQSGRPVPKAA